MANTKLDRIERDIEKTRAKILEYQKRLKDLEAQKIEEENAQIVQMVKAVHLDGAQLAAVSGGAFYYFKIMKLKKDAAKGSSNLDDLDFDEDDEEELETEQEDEEV